VKRDRAFTATIQGQATVQGQPVTSPPSGGGGIALPVGPVRRPIIEIPRHVPEIVRVLHVAAIRAGATASADLTKTDSLDREIAELLALDLLTPA
jgi:hypothetical protein